MLKLWNSCWTPTYIWFILLTLYALYMIYWSLMDFRCWFLHPVFLELERQIKLNLITQREKHRWAESELNCAQRSKILFCFLKSFVFSDFSHIFAHFSGHIVQFYLLQLLILNYLRGSEEKTRVWLTAHRHIQPVFNRMTRVDFNMRE